MDHPLIRDGWFTEEVSCGLRQTLRVDRIVHAERSATQDVLIFDNSDMGRVLALDGVVQLTTADEFIYHEMMAHVPVLSHPHPQRVLIVGGGDGGILREILKHPDIMATLVEIDDSIVQLSRRYFPAIHDGAFDHDRARIVIADGVAYMAETTETFDIIIVDSSDPAGPSRVLFTPEFYRACRTRLNPGGIMTAMMGVPFTDAAPYRAPCTAFRATFPEALAYQFTVPTYQGGPLMAGFATTGPSLHTGPRPLSSAIAPRHYNTDVHTGAFALPGYMADLL